MLVVSIPFLLSSAISFDNSFLCLIISIYLAASSGVIAGNIETGSFLFIASLYLSILFCISSFLTPLTSIPDVGVGVADVGVAGVGVGVAGVAVGVTGVGVAGAGVDVSGVDLLVSSLSID